MVHFVLDCKVTELWFNASTKVIFGLGINSRCFKYRLIVGTLFHIFAMSATKWHIRLDDCSLNYADFQRLYVFKTFKFGASFGPRWFSLGFEFEIIYGKICRKTNNPTKNHLSYFGWVGKIMSWPENYSLVCIFTDFKGNISSWFSLQKIEILPIVSKKGAQVGWQSAGHSNRNRGLNYLFTYLYLHWYKYFGGFLLFSKIFPDFPLCEYN